MSNLSAVSAFFTSESWGFQPNEDRLSARFKGEHGEWQCFVMTTPDDSRVMFYSVLSTPAPVEKRLAVAELLTRANHRMVLGNWELDFSDGEVRYKTSAFTGEDDIDLQHAAALAFPNVLTTDRYLPAILGVMFGDLTPLEALRRVESSAT